MDHLSTMKTKAPCGRRQRSRGVAALEFAMLIIPLLILLAGVVEFGRLIFQYNTLTKTVRDSARYLSIQNPSDPNYPAAAARCLAVHGNPTCTGAPLVPGLTTAMVVICNPVDSSACPGEAYAAVETGHGTVNLVEVQVRGYQFQAYLPGMTNLTSIVFDDIGVTMRQVL